MHVPRNRQRRHGQPLHWPRSCGQRPSTRRVRRCVRGAPSDVLLDEAVVSSARSYQPFRDDARLFEFVNLRMTRQRRMPHERYARQLGLDDHRVQIGFFMMSTLPVQEGRFEPKKHLRKLEPHLSAGGEIDQRDWFSSLQKPRRLLIRRSTLIVAVVEVGRQQRSAVTLPPLVIGTGKLCTRLPVRTDWAKARRWR